MRPGLTAFLPSCVLLALLVHPAAAEKTSTPPGVAAISLPGAPSDGVSLDYLAVDHAHHRVWVPAGGTGNTIVIDGNTREISKVTAFATREVEWHGRKRTVGPSSVTVGDGFVYVGNRADGSVCAIDAATLQRAGCATVPGSPDGVVYVARTKEVWVTTPREQSIVILDVSKPETPKPAGSIKLEGDPEGYAVDDDRGLFYTNLEDKDRTLRIEVERREVTANWNPACGESGPRGLALETKDRMLIVACTDHVEVMDAAGDGRVLSALDAGRGVDNLGYLPSRRALYIAAAGAGTLTVAHLDDKGGLTRTTSIATARGARNAVVTEDGTAFIADGPDGRILVVPPSGR